MAETQGERITKLEAGYLNHDARLDKQDLIIDSVHKLAISFEGMAADQQNIKHKVEQMDKRVECLMLAPAKKWDAISLGIVSTIVAAIIGMVVGKFI